MSSTPPDRLGATLLGDGCAFRVWAPAAERVELHLVRPEDRLVAMERDGCGYYAAIVPGISAGARYTYRLNGELERPDPASAFQPLGVHGPSEVVDIPFPWTDQSWHGVALENYVIYELHVGTFTAEGTFEAVIPHLDYLRDVGVTAIELLPVAQFPGRRNWGYDGVYPFAVQDSYGGPQGLFRLVDACHAHGLAVVLDAVYNHLGPEGNYLRDFGPYFTDRYKTPWGAALNFDGQYSDHVREFFLQSARQWLRDYHVDALRLDAIDRVVEQSARPFVLELTEERDRLRAEPGRQSHLIAEIDLNASRYVRPREQGGLGYDAHWMDDFHHALHALLTGERAGYYEDFGSIEQMARAFGEGYVYSGQYSRYRKRRHGDSPAGVPPQRFVVCSQNHDQVGNRPLGDRPIARLPLEARKLAAAAVLLSPYTPLLFMGEEYGETAPFMYFIDHSDLDLVEAVRKGRREEFAHFDLPDTEWADPDDPATFERCRLDHSLRETGEHRVLLDFYRELLRVRRDLRVPGSPLERDARALPDERTVFVRQAWDNEREALTAFHFGEDTIAVSPPFEGRWRKVLDSNEERWQGTGETLPDFIESPGPGRLTFGPQACAMFIKEN